MRYVGIKMAGWREHWWIHIYYITLVGVHIGYNSYMFHFQPQAAAGRQEASALQLGSRKLSLLWIILGSCCILDNR